MATKMTSPFDSLTPILYRLSVEIFRLCLLSYRSKVIRVYLFGWKYGIPVPKFVGFDPEM
jgi:hypothetical protein